MKKLSSARGAPRDKSSRPARVAERVRVELMDLLVRGSVKDPRASGAVVHAVVVSGDLRHAKVFVRLGDPDAGEPERRALLAALERASGFLRRELGSRLEIRHVPELRFYWDDTAERALRVEELLATVRDGGSSEEGGT